MDKIVIWFADSMGSNIHYVISNMYFEKHHKFPNIEDQFPKFITKLGYPCTTVSDIIEHNKTGKKRKIYGLKMNADTATAFILRFG